MHMITVAQGHKCSPCHPHPLRNASAWALQGPPTLAVPRAPGGGPVHLSGVAPQRRRRRAGPPPLSAPRSPAVAACAAQGPGMPCVGGWAKRGASWGVLVCILWLALRLVPQRCLYRQCAQPLRGPPPHKVHQHAPQRAVPLSTQAHVISLRDAHPQWDLGCVCHCDELGGGYTEPRCMGDMQPPLWQPLPAAC